MNINQDQSKYRLYLSSSMLRRISSALQSTPSSDPLIQIMDNEIIKKIELVLIKEKLGLTKAAYTPVSNVTQQARIADSLGVSLDETATRELAKARILSPEDELEYKRLEILAESGTLPPEDEPRFNELFMKRNQLS
jgi:hypothetical protein